jgi:hypothetical protein
MASVEIDKTSTLEFVIAPGREKTRYEGYSYPVPAEGVNVSGLNHCHSSGMETDPETPFKKVIVG